MEKFGFEKPIAPNFHESKTLLSKTSIANQQNESQSATEANYHFVKLP